MPEQPDMPHSSPPYGAGAASRRVWLAAVLGITSLLIAAALACWAFWQPAPGVPVPPNPAALDPALRKYVDEKVAWARQAPREASRHAMLGLVYAANGLWPEARLAFENAVRLDPKQPLSLLYLAVSCQELGQPDRAVQLLRECTNRFATFAPAYYRLGDYALRVGAFDESERAFDSLVQLAPREWRGFAGLGEIKLRRGDAAGAVPLLEKALEIDSTARPAHALLGQAYQQLGRVDAAKRELALGVTASHFPMPDAWSDQARLHMRLPFNLIEMAQEYIKAGAPDKAIHVLEPAAPFHPDHPTLLITLASAYTLAGKPQKARPILDHILQANSNSVPAYVALSGCDWALGQAQSALSNANRAISLATNQAEPFLARANALLAMERDAEAVTALERASLCDSNNAQILVDLGDVRLRNLNQPELALADYQKAIARDPALVTAHLRVAELSFKLGDRAAARSNLEAARKLAPHDPSIAAALERVSTNSAP